MATGAPEAVRPSLQLSPAVVAAGGTLEAVRPSDGDEAGGDFGHGTVPRQECHANIPSSDIPDTMPCVAGTMCISNCGDYDGALLEAAMPTLACMSIVEPCSVSS